MAIYEGYVDAELRSFTYWFQLIKSLMVNDMGFVCEYEDYADGYEPDMVMIFSLQGHYHRVKIYIYSNNICSAILNTDNSTEITYGTIWGPAGYVSDYKAVSFNGAVSLWLNSSYTGFGWGPLFAYDSAGLNKIAFGIKQSPIKYLFPILNEENIVGDYQQLIAQVAENTTTSNYHIINNVLYRYSNSLYLDTPFDNIKCCGTHTRTLCGKIQIGTKKYMIIYNTYCLIRYE